MLGVSVFPGSLYSSDLEYYRYKDEADFSNYSPSLSDPLTVHLIWESIKDFKLDNYSLVRVFENSIWKVGFRRRERPPILLFSSDIEGHAAARSWMWFAGRNEP